MIQKLFLNTFPFTVQLQSGMIYQTRTRHSFKFQNSYMIDFVLNFTTISLSVYKIKGSVRKSSSILL